MERQNAPQRKRRKHSSGNGLLSVLALLFVFIALLVVLQSCNRILGNGPDTPSQTTDGTTPGTGSSSTPEGTTDPDDPTTPEETTDPTPHVVSTASVGVTGDILMHGPVIEAGKAAAGKADSYDFTSMFQYAKPYYEEFDLMVANLECTLGGPDAGPYKGYPTFNCPDAIVDALKGAGVDLMLTSNNHAYDTGFKGFVRTLEVLQEKGMLTLGTQLEEDATEYIVQDLNGIKVGMISYTYETGNETAGRISLNDIPLNAQASNMVTCFNYGKLDAFYSHLQTQLDAMEADGAEATIVFMHWGNEYELSPTSSQKKIAQKLCELGVDVIVGGHPHVVEPFTTLTSETGHKTYCIYSVGNALSNQNRVSLKDTQNNKYTEDGMIFGVTFEKWNDGHVEVAEIEITPTWVNKEWRTDRNIYAIIPLDASVPAWNNFDVTTSSRLAESYNRTISLVGEGLNQCRESLGLEAVVTSVSNK